MTTKLHADVLARDRMCVRAKIDPTYHECRDVWGTPHRADDLAKLQLDHVQKGYGRMGQRAPSSMRTLVALCAHSHLNGWATSHRPELRDYLQRIQEM